MKADISSETFERLQRLAEPLVDSLDSVIGRLLDRYEADESAPVKGSLTSQQRRLLNAAAPPDLKHTKVLEAFWDRQRLAPSNTTWNGLLLAAVRSAKKAAASESDFRMLMIAKFVNGQKENEGYRYLEDTGISVQGQDANSAWKGAFFVARALKIRVDVSFTWRNKPDAAHPGDIGHLLWSARE